MTRRRIRWITLVPLLIFCVNFGAARAAEESSGPNPFLAQARQLYEALQYEQCLLRIQQAAQWKSTRQELVDIEIFGGLCQFALGNRRAADEHFMLALRLDEAAALPPLSSPKALAAFERVRASAVGTDLQMGPPAAHEAGVAPSSAGGGPAQDVPRQVTLAPTPPTEGSPNLPTALQPSSASVARAKTPTATWYLAGGALLSAGAAALFWSNAKSYEGRANAEPFEARAFALGEKARTRAGLAYGSTAVSAGLATAALWIYLRRDEGASP